MIMILINTASNIPELLQLPVKEPVNAAGLVPRRGELPWRVTPRPVIEGEDEVIVFTGLA